MFTEGAIMNRGAPTLKRPSGCQQRKTKQARIDSEKAMNISLLKFVKKIDEGGRSMKAQSTSATEPKQDDSKQSLPEFNQGQSSNNIQTSFDHLADISHWKYPLIDSLRVEIIKKGFDHFQNKDGPFTATVRCDENAKGEVRQLSKHWFYRSMPNGENVLRSWMPYSLFNDQLYCFCCRLFASVTAQHSFSFVTDFQQWWKLSPKIQNHENSNEHLRCLESWKTLEMGLKKK